MQTYIHADIHKDKYKEHRPERTGDAEDAKSGCAKPKPKSHQKPHKPTKGRKAKKPRSEKAKKPRSQEAESQKAKKPRSQEAEKPRSQEAKSERKRRRKTGNKRRQKTPETTTPPYPFVSWGIGTLLREFLLMFGLTQAGIIFTRQQRKKQASRWLFLRCGKHGNAAGDWHWWLRAWGVKTQRTAKTGDFIFSLAQSEST